MAQHGKAVAQQQAAVFGGRQAVVGKGDAVHDAGRFPVVGAAGKKEQAARSGMGGENGKHGPLVIIGEVKETVPGQDRPKRPPQRQPTHVADNPGHVRETLAAFGDHGRGAVKADDRVSGPDAKAGQRFPCAAAQIENRRPWRQLRPHRCQIGLLHGRIAGEACGRKPVGNTLVALADAWFRWGRVLGFRLASEGEALGLHGEFVRYPEYKIKTSNWPVTMRRIMASGYTVA